MVFSWWKQRRRRRLVAEPFPSAWLSCLDANIAFYALLGDDERAKLRDDLRVFRAEHHWEGCGGLAIDEEMQVTISAQACLLVLGFEGMYFEHVTSILVYPNAYLAPEWKVEPSGVVTEGHQAREGEAWHGGPVVLSWDRVLAGGRGEDDGHNLVLHEFSHQLDLMNGGEADGVPPLPDEVPPRRWRKVMNAEYARLVRDCRQRLPTVLDCYGAADLGEFFSVATECFFMRPRRLANHHPQLYRLLHDFYRQDPAGRVKRLE